ncbi:MAG: hydroxymethylglutaryl-CoA synthase [Candidatus Diapherotrites archaeon]|uniref:Hydroxymethylglutaryl-CoA synthase n=1 Tax=Candidatus Iainarchaeum sp. TaxID=3101447 RepID=A0A8T4L8A7_9ARCH|nr:hydroxymethylglutaryl-CoA synthase [Candidatus Diapherotrites archaeon]
MNPVGIVGYGCFVPRLRISVEEIATTWKKDPLKIKEGLGLTEKAVAAIDEDTATISVEIGRRAIEDFNITPIRIGAVYVGSESHPYAVKPTAGIVGEALGCGPEFMAADLEFACKAGTAGIQACMGLVASEMIEYGLAIGADTAQGKPNDALEFSAGSGGAGFIVGRDKKEMIATIDDTFSFTTDTPDFWRRQHAEFPRHAGRFTGEPAYFKHVIGATKGMLKKAKLSPADFDWVVFHQPNGKFPVMVAKMLGVERNKIEQGLLTPLIGNTYSGASMVGLASVLDVAKPKDRILVTSYGSGSGSDSFVLTATNAIEKRRSKVPVLELIKDKEYISYAEYAKHRKKLKNL